MVKYQMQKKTNAGLEMVDLTANVDKNVIIPTIEILEEIEDVVYNDETGDYVVLPVEKRLITDEEWHFFNTYLTANIRERRNANLPGSTIDDETGVCRTYIQQSMQKTLTNRKFVYTDEEKTITYTIVKEGSDYYFIKKYIYKEPIITFNNYYYCYYCQFDINLTVKTKDFRIQNIIRQRISKDNSNYFFQLMRLTKPEIPEGHYIYGTTKKWTPMNKIRSGSNDTGITGFYSPFWQRSSKEGCSRTICPEVKSGEEINYDTFETSIYIGIENFSNITSNISKINVTYDLKPLATQMAYFDVKDIIDDNYLVECEYYEGILRPKKGWLYDDWYYQGIRYTSVRGRVIGARHPLGKVSLKYKFRLIDKNNIKENDFGEEEIVYDNVKNYDSDEFTITYKTHSLENIWKGDKIKDYKGIEVAIKMN